MVSLGQWSYAFYLTHATVIYLTRLIWGHQPPAWHNLVFVVPLLAATTFVAFVFYRLVEHPTERRLRSMLPPLEPDRRVDAPETAAVPARP